MTVTDHTPIDFNPMVSPHREDPHLFYRAARQRPPVLSPTLGAYLVTRYADPITVIDDPDTYSSKAALPMIYANPRRLWPSSSVAASRKPRWSSTRTSQTTCVSAASSTPGSPGPGCG
jgi:cytochrome P450